jgi:putative membrane protein
MLAVVSLHVFPPAIFALIHGAKSYGWGGILMFVAISLLIGNIFENLGVRTGFPDGHYYFTEVMGPKLLDVPILLGLAYVGMAYLSWTLARLILGGMQVPLVGNRVIALPLVAAFTMIAWDLSQDPIWATILRCWVWLRGGAYFGVPVTNFLGWYLVVYVIYQLFALYLRRCSRKPEPLSAIYWYQALLFYGVSAGGNLLLVIPRPGLSVVSDPTGKPWIVSDITSTCALVTLFTMGAFALLAWIRLAQQKGTTEFILVCSRNSDSNSFHLDG